MCFPWMLSGAINAFQTTYVIRDFPKQIRITHSLHPLCGERLDVVSHRRQASEMHWIVLLPDGSRNQIPSSWTDHPAGLIPSDIFQTGGRATPESLRDLIMMLDSLVTAPAIQDACACVPSEGDQHEQATHPIRSEHPASGMADLDWNRDLIRVVDEDLAQSAARCLDRTGF